MTIASEVAIHIREYNDTFVQAFHDKDPMLLRPYCHVPSTSFGKGRMFIINSMEESDERWRRTHAGMPQDYHHSVQHTVDVLVTDPQTAFVTVDIGRFNNDGKEYHRFWASYITINTDEGWRITTWIGHGSDQAPEHAIL